jgi:hypothetical protein
MPPAQSGIVQATPTTPWPVVYVPAGTGANGQQVFMPVPVSALGAIPPGSPASAGPLHVPPATAEPGPPPMQGLPREALPELELDAVALEDPK